MNLRSVDLNLLVVLQAVLEEAHVSRAARRLGMSQPAVSNALERCRALFADPLIEREGRAMVPTARGRALRADLEQVLGSVAGLLSPGPERLDQIERPVRIMLPEPLTAQLLGHLAGRLQQCAPGIVPILQRWESGDEAARALDRGATDLAISGGEVGPPSPLVEAVQLGRQEAVLAMREGHPAAPAPDLSQWLSFSHVIVSTEGRTSTSMDLLLAERGLSRRVGLVVPNFTLALNAVQHTDLIAQVPEGVARQYPGALLLAPPPVPQGTLILRLLRHRRSAADVAVDFVSREVIAAFAEGAA